MITVLLIFCSLVTYSLSSPHQWLLPNAAEMRVSMTKSHVRHTITAAGLLFLDGISWWTKAAIQLWYLVHYS